MSQEIVKQSQMALEAQVVEPQGNLMAVIARAAANPSVDVEKMQALLSMHERMTRAAAEKEFKAALARIQPRMPRVVKGGLIEHNGRTISRFARYEDLDKAIRPLLAEEGFAIDFDTEEAGGKLKVILKVSHRDGHSEPRQVTLPLDTSGAKNGVQGVGSTFTYGKRYLVQNFFNIITTDDPVDDDGNGGLITEDQALTIETLLRDTKADRVGFLKFAGASSVDAIPASQYARCINAIKQKAAKR